METSSTHNDLPQDIEGLTALVGELQGKVDQQKNLIDQLLEAIRLSRHQHFGTRSEKCHIDQLDCLIDANTQTDADEFASANSESIKVKSFNRKKGGRRRLPDHLPRVEVVHELEGDACRCDHCNSDLEVIGQKASEQIDLVSMTVKVIRHVRKTYRCPNCKDSVLSAKRPAQPIPGSIASPGTLAHIATDKYVNGLPLYRQQAQFDRLGIPLTRSTLSQWMIKVGVQVQPLVNLLRERMLNGDIIQMDETRCQVLNEPGKTPQSQSTMWVQRGGTPEHSIILFDYSPSRSQDVPMALLQGYSGYLQTDGYEGYNRVSQSNPITQLGCSTQRA